MSQFATGDMRLAWRGAWLFEQMVATRSVVLRRAAGDRAGEIGAQRYLASSRVTPQGIVAALASRTAEACSGRRVVAAQDTTEINFAGRTRPPKGLGPAGDGETAGFFIHPVVAVDVENEAVLGLVDAQIWTRTGGPTPDRHKRPIEAKESVRWLKAAEAAAKGLEAAAEVVMVSDQEGDIWACLARRPASVQQLIRARHDRVLEGGQAMFERLAGQPALGSSPVKVAPRGPGDKGRTAEVTLRACRLSVRRPAAERTGPQRLELTLVEAREEAAPAGVKPLLWRLITTLPAEDFAEAAEIVRLYRLRWRIEEVFRALKRDGLRLEDTQVQDANRLFKLAALGLGAAVRTIQLVDARDGGPRPMSDVLDPSLTPAVAAIVRSREGATPRQQNPHPQGSLAWLAWVVARFGGWNCYGKPPGPKTMAIGWEAFIATLSGYILALSEADP
jgi:hypothetical protein